MGLRLLTVFFERSEALVARGALDSAGIFTALHNLDILVMAPYYTLGLGGYRLLVCEDDVEAARSIVAEALENPTPAHERLEVDGDGLDFVLSFVIGVVAGGAPAAMRRRRWIANAEAGTQRVTDRSTPKGVGPWPRAKSSSRARKWASPRRNVR